MLIKFLLTHLLISDVSVFLGQKSIFEFWQISQSQNTVLQLPVFNENRPTLESENLHEAEKKPSICCTSSGCCHFQNKSSRTESGTAGEKMELI